MEKKFKKKRRKPKNLKSSALKDKISSLYQRKPQDRFNAAQIKKKLKITNSKDAINHVLQELQKSGVLKEVKEGRYKLNKPKGMSTTTGIADMTQSGNIYVISEHYDKDIFVPRNRTANALDGDEVEVLVRGNFGGKIEGEILKVTKRSKEFFFGTYQENKDFGFVVVHSGKVPFDFYVNRKDSLGAKDQSKVVIKVENWGDGRTKSPIARVTSILDNMNPHEFSMQSILVGQGFMEDFPESVEKAAQRLDREISKEEIERRRDFRGVTTFTIDPDTAKDFDDALSVQVMDNGNIEIGVHIADVTHYVKPDSVLDKEAYRRSTSVYLVDRVAPMLPERLSNELCSLRPDEESLTFSAVFVLDQNHGIVDEWYGKTVIYSDKRFTYEEAQELIEAEDVNQDYKKEINILWEAYRVLRKRRFKEGAVDFESKELKIILDEDNHPVRIVPKVRLDAHMLIEEFMLLANRKVAEFVYRKEKPEIPFVYRIHDLPDQEKLTEYALFLKDLGFNFYADTPGAIRSSINRLTVEAKTNEVLALVQPMAIRMMSKAIYATDNIGHFGLGFAYYTHFTSPIRRYSDVLVHRILEDNLDKTKRYDKGLLSDQCVHISAQERKAIDAERESIKYKQVEFMSDFVGKDFDGIVSGIIDRGMFIRIVENHCEGMVEFKTMIEGFDVAPNRLKAQGRISGIEYKLGDPVRIRVTKTDLELRQIEMELIEDEELF